MIEAIREEFIKYKQGIKQLFKEEVISFRNQCLFMSNGPATQSANQSVLVQDQKLDRQ